VARNRQRAKQRQAERRAARPGDPDHVGHAPAPARERPASDEAPAPRDDAPRRASARRAALSEAELAASAPPETTGRSDTVAETPPPAPDLAASDLDSEDRYGRPDEDRPPAPGEPAGAEREGRGRVVSFLVAVVAELKRVQWPNRATLTSLTGIVLGFVLIAGGYLGLLDLIFSRLIQAIL